MLQKEIDEISEAFLDAWDEYFGQEMFYVPFLEDETTKHRVYKESKSKAYDFANKLKFTGTFKEEPLEEVGDVGGRDKQEKAEITFITKELEDKGITRIDSRAIIEITHKDGITKTYNIINNYGKVQFGSSRVFSKLGVVEIK